MSVTKYMPAPIPGRIHKIRRLTGHYVEHGEPVVDLVVGDDIVTLLSPEAGKILTCGILGQVVNPQEAVFEVTGVGKPTRELFIAYRRADSAGYAGRLGEHLMSSFGKGQAFKDVDTLPPGVDFPEFIRTMLRRAAAMVVVIGPQWLTLRSDRGPRIHDANDLHREEIRTAPERGISVFPVLVNAAQMPARDDLPEDIRALSDRQAVEVTDTRWDYDVGIVAAGVHRALEASPRRAAFLEQLKSRQGGLQWIADDPFEASRTASRTVATEVSRKQHRADHQ